MIASILVTSEDEKLAAVLGKVVGLAVEQAGFSDIHVTHVEDIDSETEEIVTNLSDAPTLLQAMKDANPDLFDTRIQICSAVAEPFGSDNGDTEDEDALPDDASAHLAAIAAEDS